MTAQQASDDVPSLQTPPSGEPNIVSSSKAPRLLPGAPPGGLVEEVGVGRIAVVRAAAEEAKELEEDERM